MSEDVDEEPWAVDGTTRGFTLEAAARASVISGTLKPSYLVLQVLRRTSVVRVGT